MTIGELADRLGVTVRQIRFLIAEGFIPPPTGGRAHARYGDDHIAAITRYMALREAGMPPAAIRILLENDMAAVFPVVPGISLHVDPDLIGGELDRDAIRSRLDALLDSLVKDTTDARSDRDPTAEPPD